MRLSAWTNVPPSLPSTQFSEAFLVVFFCLFFSRLLLPFDFLPHIIRNRRGCRENGLVVERRAGQKELNLGVVVQLPYKPDKNIFCSKREVSRKIIVRGGRRKTVRRQFQYFLISTRNWDISRSSRNTHNNAICPRDLFFKRLLGKRFTKGRVLCLKFGLCLFFCLLLLPDIVPVNRQRALPQNPFPFSGIPRGCCTGDPIEHILSGGAPLPAR